MAQQRQRRANKGDSDLLRTGARGDAILQLVNLPLVRSEVGALCESDLAEVQTKGLAPV